MGIWKSFAGTYTLEITSASPSDTITAISLRGITLLDVVFVDDLRIRVSIYRYNFESLTDCLSKRGEKWKILKKHGVYWTVRNLKKRPILILGCLLYAIMVLYLPTRVLFVDVQGNENVPKRLIVAEAEKCGIEFGASRREVRSEKMKNALLSAVPQLQWAGVNTAGCVAVISVKERGKIQDARPSYGVSSIVADRDGIISNVTVTKGNALCKAGQAVKEGQLLVSGYTDCGLFIKAEQAEAEINATTMRNLDAVSLASFVKRSTLHQVDTHYSIRIGKNIINFCKDSGISDGKYVKMYKEAALTLPGGFALPIAFVTEQIMCYDYTQQKIAQPEDITWLKKKAEAYLYDQMIAGRINDSGVSVELANDVYCLTGYYSCHESIGRVRIEEIVTNNGKRDGQNR